MADTESLELPLTGLDKTFAKFLEEVQPSTDARHGLLAALASHQFGSVASKPGATCRWHRLVMPHALPGAARQA